MNGCKTSLAGTQPRIEAASGVFVTAPTPAVEARSAVRALAEAGANARGATLVGSALRLFDEAPASVPAAETVSPFDLGRTYELRLAPDARRRSGAHLTPEGVARGLVGLMDDPAVGDRILDPAVGGAAFLLAAADRLVVLGARPEAVLDQLFGVDIDPYAVEVAEAALALWSIDHGVVPRSLPQLVVGDGLLNPLPEVDQVVGNPPFLNQLRKSSSHTADRRRALRDRWGDLIGAYTDDAWLFLAAGLDALRPGGSIAMVQPVSILAARHADAVRHHVTHTGYLRGLWVAKEQVFDAAVQVCGIVARRRAPAVRQRALVRAVGADFEVTRNTCRFPEANGWGSAAATALGAPEVFLGGEGVRTLSEMAETTAGFRDQFYGYVPHVFDDRGVGDVTELGDDAAPLVTVGMIDPLSLRWGTRSFKFAGKAFVRPAVDLPSLTSENPTLASWTRARRRPKLLVATQTRVVEVWVDATGTVIPATPVVSIEPHDASDEVLWKLAAVLASPVLSAYFFSRNFGTAMSLDAMKVSARDLAAAPLPDNAGPWSQAAELLRAGQPDLDHFGALMCAAYGVDPPDLVTWWKQRLPNRSDG